MARPTEPVTSAPAPRSLLFPLAGLVVCLLLWPAMVTFDGGDWPSPHQYPHNSPAHNACGPVGAWCAFVLRHYLGDGVYPLLLFATMAAITRLVRGWVGNAVERIFGLALLVACTSASAHLISGGQPADMPGGHGGLLGFALGELMTDNLSRLGTIIILLSTLFVGLLFVSDGWVLTLPSLVARAGVATGDVVARAREVAARGSAARVAGVRPVLDGVGVSGEESAALLHAAPSERGGSAKKRARRKEQSAEDAGLFDDEDDEAEEIDAAGVADRSAKAKSPAENAARAADAKCDEQKPPVKAAATGAAIGDKPAMSEKPAGAEGTTAAIKPASSLVVRFPKPQPPGAAEAYPRQIADWQLPSMDLLTEPEYGFTAQQETVVRDQARILEQTLEDFRVEAEVVEIDTGPVITLFELRLGTGVKVSQIGSLANDIARALKAQAIRVVAPIPGKNTVGVEVPNVQKEKVRLKELMGLSGKKATNMALPLFLGKDAGGAALVTDLASAPHMLIAGTTGSGKSVCLNSIIVSLLMTKAPDRVKLILVDPKMVEMSNFKEVPHLMCPIVTDMARAEQILEWAVTKMDERYELLAEAGVKNIKAFNDLGRDTIYARFQPSNDQEKAQIPTHLPYIVIIIDELADLMMTSAKEVEHHLSRLAQKSRAVGVHIVVATQRPEAKVVTGLIKSNLPCRVAFRVASRMDSRIVLDQNGAEVLMGQGDMLLLPPGSHKLLRAQGTYLEDSEIQAVLHDLAGRAKPEFHPELMRLKGGESSEFTGERDPLFDQAVRVVLETRRGSVSLLQRRLTVGYSRASRLIDQMAEAGIVGEYKGSQAREVTMTLEEWEAYRAHVAADMQQNYEADQMDDDSPVPDLSDDHDIRG